MRPSKKTSADAARFATYPRHSSEEQGYSIEASRRSCNESGTQEDSDIVRMNKIALDVPDDVLSQLSPDKDTAIRLTQPRPKVLRYVVYLRCSADEQVLGYSIDAQRHRCDAFIAKNGGIKVGEYVDEGRSGKNVAKRPAFRRMMEAARRGEFDGICVDKIDRFARNVVDGVTQIHLLEHEYRVQLRSVCDDIDPGSPFAMMFRTFLLSLAEWFLRNLSEEVIKGQVRMFADKRYIGKAPFGYVMRNPKSKQSQLIPGADARFVVQAYELYLAGATYVDIARQINAIVGSEVLTEQSVRHMLSNKIYRGIKQGRILDPDETKKTIVVEQYFPALDIVEADLWTRVQQRRATYGRRPQSPQRKAHGHLLSGLVHCDSCDGPLDGNWSAGERRYYRCRTRARRATKNACPQVSVRASDLDAHVVLIVHRLHAHLTDLTDARLRAYLDTDVSKGAARVRIAQLEDFLRRLTETYLAGDIAPDRYKADKEAGKAELHACQDHLDVALECALERVMAAVRLVPLDIPYRDMAQLGVINDALHHIISKIRVRGHTIVEVTYSDLAIQLCAALDIAPETLWVATTPKVPHSAPVDIEGTRQLAMFGPEGSDASTPLCPVRGRHRRTPARSRAAVVTCTPEQMTLWTSGEPCLGHVLPDSGERGR